MSPHVAKEQLEAFDVAMTEALLDILDIAAEHRDEFREQVHDMRGLPLKLSGGAMRHMARPSTRMEAVRLARDSVLRYADKFDTPLAVELRGMWGEEVFSVERIKPTEAFDSRAAADKDVLTQALQGHDVGNVPEESVEKHDVRTDLPTGGEATRHKARATIKGDALAADLVFHTSVMRKLRVGSNEQYQTKIAAQLLSQSCVNTGVATSCIPAAGNALQDPLFVHAMRLRLGVPCVLPLSAWCCTCQQWKPRRDIDPFDAAIDGNPEEHGLQKRRFTREPFHGLVCRARQKRLTFRHNKVRDAVARFLTGSHQDISATVEPSAGVPGKPNMRADIRVTKGSTTWLLDVGIVSAATTTQVTQHHTHEVPGAAAEVYARTKRDKYHPARVIPFIIEAGGRFGREAVAFVDNIFDRDMADFKTLRRRLYRLVVRLIECNNAYMHSRLVLEMGDRRRQRAHYQQGRREDAQGAGRDDGDGDESDGGGDDDDDDDGRWGVK